MLQISGLLRARWVEGLPESLCPEGHGTTLLNVTVVRQWSQEDVQEQEPTRVGSLTASRPHG